MIYDSIALCGERGKGAYPVGVMKALKENGILNKINSISGSSAGAIKCYSFMPIRDLPAWRKNGWA